MGGFQSTPDFPFLTTRHHSQNHRASRTPGEFELIDRLSRRLRTNSRAVVGIGDDCAVLDDSRGRKLFTIDSMVEGVHFKLEWADPRDWGRRALTVNLSDIAAMGGTPTACVVNLGVRAGVPAAFFERLYDGLRSAASPSKVDVVGGNITGAAQVTITIALLGIAGKRVLLRSAARPGDQIFVTGHLGDAALGWRILDGKLGASSKHRNFLVNRFVNPTAQLEAGRALSRLTKNVAAIDVSDGLLQDLGHVLEQSRVGAEIDASLVPISAAYRAVAGSDLEFALTGGEDYELLFCLKTSLSDRDLSRRLGVRVTRIGRIMEARRGLNVIGYEASMRLGFDQLRAHA